MKQSKLADFCIKFKFINGRKKNIYNKKNRKNKMKK